LSRTSWLACWSAPFAALLDRHDLGERTTRAKLNAVPLVHEEWGGK